MPKKEHLENKISILISFRSEIESIFFLIIQLSSAQPMQIFNYLFIYLFLAVLGLRFYARAFSSCGKRGPLFIAVRGPLTIAASPAAEHRIQTRRLSSCGSRAQPLRGMWDLPRPGLEPVFPALAGRLSTTAPPEKPGKPIFTKGYVPREWILSMEIINKQSIVRIEKFYLSQTKD